MVASYLKSADSNNVAGRSSKECFDQSIPTPQPNTPTSQRSSTESTWTSLVKLQILQMTLRTASKTTSHPQVAEYANSRLKDLLTLDVHRRTTISTDLRIRLTLHWNRVRCERCTSLFVLLSSTIGDRMQAVRHVPNQKPLHRHPSGRCVSTKKSITFKQRVQLASIPYTIGFDTRLNEIIAFGTAYLIDDPDSGSLRRRSMEGSRCEL